MMKFEAKLIYLSILAVCIVSVAVHASDTHEKDLGKKASCNSTLDKPAQKVEFNHNFTDYICNFTIKPENGSNIYIMLTKMVLDEGDNVTISTIPLKNGTREDIFYPFHAQPDAIILYTGVRELFIELRTSHRHVQREFAASYQAQDCIFTVDDDISTIASPVYAKTETEEKACTLKYVVTKDPNVTFAFNFDSYNLSASAINVINAAEGALTFTESDFPGDFMSSIKDMDIILNINPATHNSFVLRRHMAYSGCSMFVGDVRGMETISSPPLPKLIDRDVPVECHWHFKNKVPNEGIGLKFTALNLESISDIVTVTDGSRISSLPLLQITKSTQNSSLAQEIRTSSSEMIMTFKPETFESNITFQRFSSGSGKYMKNNGTIVATPSAVSETVFLLEVQPGENVVLNFISFNLVPPAELDIYEDFTKQSRKIATLRSDVWYPIISSTSKLMVVGVNYKEGKFEAQFGAAAAGCMHMTPGTSDTYILSGNCNSTCSWIIPPVDHTDGVLLLDLQYLALESDDKITVLHLDKNKTVVATVTSNMTHVSQFSLNTAVGAYVNVTRGACSRGESEIVLVARANYLPSCSQTYTLSPDQVLQLTSPNHPDTYPLFLHCNSSIKQSSKTSMLHLAFDELQLSADHCIQVSYVSENGSSSFQVTGDQMPDDFILKGEVAVLFNSGSCNTTKEVSSYVSKQGFVLNVTSISCGGVVTDKNGKLKIGENTTICIYKITVPTSETDGSVNTIIYSVQEGKIGNFKLDVYDGPTVRSNVIKNNSDTNIWSHTNSLIIMYRRIDESKPSGVVIVEYQTKSCDKLMLCENGICMHPDWKCNGKNDCGDYSDEKNCESEPSPSPPAPGNVGISPVTFGVFIVIFFLIGISVTLLTPWLMQKYRNRYRPFQDLSVIE